jgi:hypothetical protein
MFLFTIFKYISYIVKQYVCFESCQFRSSSVFFVSWRLKCWADYFWCLRYFTRCQVYCSKIVHTDYPIKIQHFRMLCTKFLLSDRLWGTEHQYLLSRFLGVSILQLLIIYRRIVSIPIKFRIFRVLLSEMLGRLLLVFTLLLWQRQHMIVVDAIDYK